MYTSLAPRKTMARKPSHLGSNRKSLFSGRLSASLANMGSTGGSIGNDIDAKLLLVCRLSPTRQCRCDELHALHRGRVSTRALPFCYIMRRRYSETPAR